MNANNEAKALDIALMIK